MARGETPIDLTGPVPAPVDGTLNVGGKNPAGNEINANTQYLTLDGKPWTPVMGEFHYLRYPRADWDQEMLKMKAGGITVLSTYVIWIFHEEKEGQFDWSGNKDLGAFIAACNKNGLKVSLRIGPWAHSEARNGGIPDWVIDECGKAVRTTDPRFMALTKTFYDEIFKQVKGMFWKDGGPIVDIQIDNESTNIPYLQALKQLAIQTGFDAPLYTITAWDHVRPPASGLVPMFGGYADGFWYGAGIPEKGRTHYFFDPVRDDSEIDPRTLEPTRNSPDLSYINKFPFLTCEIGGGMAIAYARRPLMSWQDVTASALTQFGAGSNLLGYYMYHGGAHPLGASGQGLQEKQDSPTTNYNDVPPIDYDFQAPIGEFGQVRPVYHSLALLHDFIADFGPQLATMPAVFPAEMPKSTADIDTLRWVVRTDGKSGYVFINNFERGQVLAAKNVQLGLKLPSGTLEIPSNGQAAVPADTFMIWPFNFDLNGMLLKYATAQLICRVDDSGTPVFVFFAPGESKSEFAFDNASLGSVEGRDISAAGATIVNNLDPGAMLTLHAKDGRPAKILLLSQAQAMHLWKANLWGAPRLVMSQAEVSFDGDTIIDTSRNPADMSIEVYPAPPKGLTSNGKALASSADGVFTKYAISTPAKQVSLDVKKVKEAGPARAIVLGTVRRPAVPTEPTDADFDAAAVWQVSVPPDALDGVHEVYLKIDYAGDVARAYIGDQFINDDFYFGQPWEIGIKRFSPSISEKGLTIKALPLRKDLPIYLEPDKVPQFNADGEALEMRSITAEPEYQLTIQAGQ
jgi:hypothetical protein